MENNIYALIVGVGNYENVNAPNLPSYRMDVALIGTALISGLKCKKENIRFMEGEDNNGFVRVSDLAQGITNLKSAMTEQDTFIFYFSGHGSGNGIVFSDDQIDLQSVINYIDLLPSKNKLLFLDCCYSGNFETDKAKQISMEQTMDDFAGHGIAVYASSAADELSRLGPREKCSVFTGALSATLISPSIIHKGEIGLQDIYRETQRVVYAWNKRNPDKAQHPVFRSCMGGTIFFKVADYKEYAMQQICYETAIYKVVKVKPLHNANEKRLCAFVVLKKNVTERELAELTKDIVGKIKYTNVFAEERSERRFINTPAKVIWCYVGMSESDIEKSTYAYRMIWASEDVRNKYYTADRNANVIDKVYIWKNTCYALVKDMQKSTLTREKCIGQYRAFLNLFINMAEIFFKDLQEVANQSISYKNLQDKYGIWMNEIKKQFIQLSDLEVAQDGLYEWTEKILELAGWILDLSLFLEGDKKEQRITDREEWLIKNARKEYYESMEKLKKIEKKVFENVG